MTINKIYTKLLHIEQMLATDNLVTPAEMAKELEIDLRTLQNWRYANKLEGCYTRNREGRSCTIGQKMKDIRL